MKNKVLVRPNLKMFLLAALSIAVLQDLISNGHSDTSILTAWARSKTLDSEKELQQLLAKAENEPSAQTYVRLSNYFERHGDFKNARMYIRRAEAISEIEE